VAIASTTAVGRLSAQGARTELRVPQFAAPVSMSPAGAGSRWSAAWQGIKWGALIGGVAAGAICAAQEECRRDGGVFEDAVFGAVAGAFVGGIAGAVVGHTDGDVASAFHWPAPVAIAGVNVRFQMRLRR
jgi:hypothetical protein